METCFVLAWYSVHVMSWSTWHAVNGIASKCAMDIYISCTLLSHILSMVVLSFHILSAAVSQEASHTTLHMHVQQFTLCLHHQLQTGCAQIDFDIHTQCRKDSAQRCKLWLSHGKTADMYDEHKEEEQPYLQPLLPP